MNQLESHDQTDFYEYAQNYTNYLQQLATYLPKQTEKKKNIKINARMKEKNKLKKYFN